jgi:hypothetical protein
MVFRPQLVTNGVSQHSHATATMAVLEFDYEKLTLVVW